MAFTFKVVFTDGHEAPIESASIRITDEHGNSGEKDLQLSDLMDVYSAVKIAREDIKITRRYPETSEDPICVKAYNEIAEIMAELFYAPEVAEVNKAVADQIITETSNKPAIEPEYWN